MLGAAPKPSAPSLVHRNPDGEERNVPSVGTCDQPHTKRLSDGVGAASPGTVGWLAHPHPTGDGPAVRVLARGFTEKLHGPGRPFSRFARAGLTKAGHVPAQEKIGQLQALGADLYACGPSMRHFKVAKTDLAFDEVTISEYLTFMETMAGADIHLLVQ